MPWTQIIISTEEKKALLLADLLTELGALSVSFQENSTEEIFELVPHEMNLWKKTKIIALFPADCNAEKITKIIQTLFGGNLSFQISRLEDQDWVSQTRNQFQPQRFGKELWIVPSWYDDKAFTGPIVKIDPGLAFGTGSHPTTALCLTWLSTHPIKKRHVLDYGCGSGILALASLALGAEEVWAVDHDSQAVLATQNNAKLNAFVSDDNLHVLLPEAMPNVKASLIIANILANPLITLAARLKSYAASDATIVLSGFLDSDIEKVSNAYTSEFRMGKTIKKSGWALIAMHRINS